MYYFFLYVPDNIKHFFWRNISFELWSFHLQWHFSGCFCWFCFYSFCNKKKGPYKSQSCIFCWKYWYSNPILFWRFFFGLNVTFFPSFRNSLWKWSPFFLWNLFDLFLVRERLLLCSVDYYQQISRTNTNENIPSCRVPICSTNSFLDASTFIDCFALMLMSSTIGFFADMDAILIVLSFNNSFSMKQNNKPASSILWSLVQEIIINNTNFYHKTIIWYENNKINQN